MKFEKMTADQLQEEIGRYLNEDCNLTLTTEQMNHIEHLSDLRDQRIEYEAIRNRLDYKGINTRIKDYTSYEIDMDHCGCCPIEGSNLITATGILEDGRTFEIHYYEGVSITKKKRNIIW